MAQPGQSLFQGAGSLHLNTSAQRQEEEEELLDQQRRRNEVQQRLDNEFGDLSDDNDDTAASNALSFSDCQPVGLPPLTTTTNHPTGAGAAANGANHQMAMMDAESERAILMVRFKEQQELEELRRRLAICESEKQRAFMARQQSHELLVESKGKISEQEDAIGKLKTKMQGLEQKNTQLETELEHKNTLLSDAQLKAQMFERSVGITADRNVDILMKQTNDRCKAQVDMMQQQIESLRSQLEERSREVKIITTRYTEVQRSRETMLVEKSETINQLSRSVEESQRHCQMLMAKNDGQTEARLQNRIHELTDQIDTMRDTIGQLERSLQTAHSDIDSMSAIINESGDRQKRSPLAGLPSNHPTTIEDTTSRLKHELQRCLSDQQQLRSELKQQQEQLNDKNAQLSSIRYGENRLLIDLEKQKDECMRNAKRVKLLQTDLTRLFRLFQKADSEDENYTERIIEEIEQEVLDGKQKFSEMQIHQENLIQELAHLRSERDLEANLVGDSDENGGSVDLKQLQNECEKLRELYLAACQAKEALTVELTAKCQEHLLSVTSLEDRLREEREKCKELADQMDQERCDFQKRIQRDSAEPSSQIECEDLRRQITNLVERLQSSNELVVDLRKHLELKRENDTLLADLQAKAAYFDKFIQSQKQESCPPDRCASAPQPCSPTTSSASNRKDEERIAKVIASKLKDIEDKSVAQETQLRKAIHQLELALHETVDTLEIRNGEVEMLKHAILAERKQTQETMDHVTAKHNTWASNLRQREDMLFCENKKLSKRLSLYMAERAAIKVDIEKKCNAFENLKKEKEQWQMERETIVRTWETKYNSIKKTAASYKKYAEDKDLYIEKENKRVILEYEKAVRKLEEKYKNRSFNGSVVNIL